MRTKDIQSLTEFRSHITEGFQHVQETGRPLFVTTKGRMAGVVLSPAVYDALVDKAELAENMALITRGLEDVRAGRVHDAREDILAIARERGLTLDR